MIPAPERSVKEIALETLDEPITRTTNYYWTEITFVLIAGHAIGSKFGYPKLIYVGLLGLSLNILYNLAKADHSTGLTNKSTEEVE